MEERQSGIGHPVKIKGLYTIIDTSYLSLEDISKVTEEIIRGGATLIQLRAKGMSSGDMLRAAKIIRDITRKSGALFLVNDRIDIALLSEADGVHIGDEDIPPQEARELLGADKVIGYSTHNTEEVEVAIGLAAKGLIDYISCGPVFPTRTKKDARTVVGLEGLKEIREKTALPLVAIGGITEENLPGLLQAGPDAVAVISELLQAQDIAAKTRQLIDTIKKDGSRG
ncbi:Thiamin-phosphate pyrophosphorylase [hydrothermal vent metagenome]|uniref:thiamine phosphate synthase n=1 Tax=hydrothermal vent metagenome TaxID=652676 RepID=A0A3B0RM82_9ZZZZ